MDSSKLLDDEIVREVVKTGTDLRQYSKQVEKELKDVENKSIQDYIKESENIVVLHHQIQDCDSILERMENMLLGFQTDLGSISSEIVSLQKKSVSMNQHLQNRQSVKSQLSQFIDKMTVSEELIVGILESPVTEKEFVKCLKTLNVKINYLKEQSFSDVKSCQDVKDILEKLKIKAVTKIRAYLIEQISKFRKPMTNYQIPQNTMLKYKFFFEFALAHERAVAHEVRNEYVDSMSKVYFSYFKYYSSLLSKMQFEEVATKDDLMGHDENTVKSLFHKASSSLKKKGTIFTIGNRGEVLNTQLEAPILIPHSASKNDERYPYEFLFRSEQYALVDNACREYQFICEYFKVQGSHAMDMFGAVLNSTLVLLEKGLKSHVESSYDTIGLFLCIHLVFRYQLMCHKRAVPALDPYWERLHKILWPRFEYVFELNIQSVRDCDPSRYSKDMRPHTTLARRYAEFSSAINMIGEQFPSERVTRLLALLLEEVELFILKNAAIYQHRKEQLIFLINNYDLVLSILSGRTRDNTKEVESFRDQLNSRSIEYVEEILSPHFGALMQAVKEGEIYQQKGDSEKLKSMEGKFESIVKNFNDRWKKSLENINAEVLSSFPSLVTGSTLLQLAFTHLVQYYHRFQDLLSPQLRNQLDNIHYIMVEIKKYKTSS
uniref:Vacuolar protein sorting-associated protein 52 homolog n=1 Tax=Cacopsylla melanoneura TaxID=428564 RepID=A0A8D9B8U8_9HEMI